MILTVNCFPLLRWCTYSSSPRKDVSLHATLRIRSPDEPLADDEEDFDFGIEASKSLQQLGAVTGVEARSELTDVRSVLQSNDVQEESEDRDGLLPSSSSCNPSPRSIARVAVR